MRKMYERENIKGRALPLLAREVDRANLFAILIAFTNHLQNATSMERIDSKTNDFAARSNGN